MLDKAMILILAKGISRRTPKKNMQKIKGKRLFELAIDRSVNSKCGDVFVSTEDEFIANKVIETPYANLIKRPKYLSQDNIRSIDVCLHAIGKMPGRYNTLIMTFPTSPLSTAQNIKEAYQMFLDNDRKPVMSVTPFKGNPFLSMRKLTENFLLPINSWEEAKESIKKKCNQYFRGNGAVFICDIEQFKKEKEVYIPGMIGYEMNEEEGLDVDTPFELRVAKLLCGDIG